MDESVSSSSFQVTGVCLPSCEPQLCCFPPTFLKMADVVLRWAASLLQGKPWLSSHITESEPLNVECNAACGVSSRWLYWFLTFESNCTKQDGSGAWESYPWLGAFSARNLILLCLGDPTLEEPAPEDRALWPCTRRACSWKSEVPLICILTHFLTGIVTLEIRELFLFLLTVKVTYYANCPL